MTKKKTRTTRRNIRRQRWAAITAGVVAVGMLVSSILIYFDNIADAKRNPSQDWQMEDYLEYYRGNVKNLEEFIEEHGATVAVLESLAENYGNLIAFGQLLPDEVKDKKDLQDKLVQTYLDLIELAPEEPRYRLDLLYTYRSAEADSETIAEQVTLLSEMLREAPQPALHLQLLSFLSVEKMDELLEGEISWLQDYLEQRIAGEDAKSMDRFYLAILAAEHLEDKDTALAQLDLILEAEEEGSSLYNEVKQYRDRLTAKEKEKEEDKKEEKKEEKEKPGEESN